MIIFRPFRGIRPTAELVKDVASRPYDVLDSQEAKKEADGNPHSFLHVVKPEIDLPSHTNPYDNAVYLKGKENFEGFLNQKTFSQDESPCFYIYRLTMDGRSQTCLLYTSPSPRD